MVNDANAARPITAGGTASTNAAAALATLGAVSKAEASFPTVGGTADALTLAPTTALAALVDDAVYTGTVGASPNATSTPTLAVSATSAKTIRKMIGGIDVALVPGDLPALTPFAVVYKAAANANGGAWILLNPATLGSLNGGPFAGLRNKLLNPNFAIDQRGKSGTVTLAAGAYGHDGWKAGSSGCIYTFAASGGVTTITISAGSLVNTIKGADLLSGTHVLSWTGTSEGRINGGTYGASGAVAAVLAGGADATVEFNSGTLSLPQLEPGSIVTPFEQRPLAVEMMLCRGRLRVIGGNAAFEQAALGQARSSTTAVCMLFLGEPMIAVPSLTVASVGNWAATNSSGAAQTCTALSLNSASTPDAVAFAVTVAGGLSAGDLCNLQANNTLSASIILSAEP